MQYTATIRGKNRTNRGDAAVSMELQICLPSNKVRCAKVDVQTNGIHAVSYVSNYTLIIAI